MNRVRNYLLYIVIPVLLGFTGCATYKVTTPLGQPLDKESRWHVGEIRDALPDDVEPEDRPDGFQIANLKDHLIEELEKKDLLQRHGLHGDCDLLVTGSILEFKKGSGFVRFMFGLGLGSAVLTTELQLSNRETGKILFSGNFKQTVSSWAESGEEVFKRVAKDFAKALKKQQKKLAKGG